MSATFAGETVVNRRIKAISESVAMLICQRRASAQLRSEAEALVARDFCVVRPDAEGTADDVREGEVTAVCSLTQSSWREAQFLP